MPIPPGYVYDPNRAVEPERHDYCTWSPDQSGFANFRAPCAGHDLCYDVDGNRPQLKGKCDDQFHENLNHQCAMAYRGSSEVGRPACLWIASRYHAAVQDHGVGPTPATLFKLPYNDDVYTSTGGVDRECSNWPWVSGTS
ncbi:hypothetical protein JT358_16050 [Micrococcales bacterium 31B]|nr:hypothetical protein [Micrococcales bacterium 31B]